MSLKPFDVVRALSSIDDGVTDRMSEVSTIPNLCGTAPAIFSTIQGSSCPSGNAGHAEVSWLSESPAVLRR
ncbi:hypothetical protein CTRI78_v010260 [Colletotrichum trifolii]|uniref:Uncharacterized protein n=1 Tax=Colletotrichum trifolii TaxID=5466 RepID=A0A4R8QNF2_COLTR|nr:hypothetical protein CTRI78_v010260 [Colletotrichum trifolii]